MEVPCRWRSIPACLAWSVVGAGTSLTVAGSLWRAVRGGGEFRRTPKFGVEGHEAGWRSKSYFRPQDRWAQVELTFGVAGLLPGRGFRQVYNRLGRDVNALGQAFVEANLVF